MIRKAAVSRKSRSSARGGNGKRISPVRYIQMRMENTLVIKQKRKRGRRELLKEASEVDRRSLSCRLGRLATSGRRMRASRILTSHRH